MAVHAFRSSSLYTLEILDRDVYWMVGLRIERRKFENRAAFYRIENSESAFTISWLNYITIVHVVE